MYPIVLYDDKCFLCTKFAQIIDLLTHNKITFIGHYTNDAKFWHDKLNDSQILEMFWVIDKDKACGGRAAILPLVKFMIFPKGDTKKQTFDSPSGCRSSKAVFLRSASLIRNKKIIKFTK